jgi:tocopherol cyclase
VKKMAKILRNPDLYHGENKDKNYFEGWYFKFVDPTLTYSCALIPGIYLSSTPEHSHSFIQFLQGSDVKYRYIKYPRCNFSASGKKFKISVNNNTFSLRGIDVSIVQEDLCIKGTLNFRNLEKWPDSAINPGSMGYYNYIPFMQCYSQVCAMDMELEGSLIINNKQINFTGGMGYIEKNWGKAFPYSWTWIQCNSFRNSKASLSCSIGHIPFLYTSFRGYLIGMYYRGNFYKFTTMNKSKLQVMENGSDKLITVENNRYILKLETKTNKDDFMLCYGPREGGMVPLVEENLKGNVWLELYDKQSRQLLLKDEGLCTGIEYGGDQMIILDKN